MSGIAVRLNQISKSVRATEGGGHDTFRFALPMVARPAIFHPADFA
jgi:hypothetical protein